ncbi:trifunctional transcriptional regulator/proline dehydrogenase/L-glutamate gamma-semialdehyde dehydrogenase [Vibrio mangrovi]|uniref:Uncharacterized protein n=1 Tax=Vibrio mangrovi TaxID=474394 RepID=A0A1Y6IP82_9VIBR|nr:trifunctional transcriptional regulator/proline dehydrogenase/L-glutamate gamma-semialdehyde dehydrogenase [Vibrio mangrovi]MDW6003742.1 hypothetical protein [Vibrio mangrovi]SMR99464.1 hypothetical protein VIM7927_00689 [Vibrio mangrovi]
MKKLVFLIAALCVSQSALAKWSGLGKVVNVYSHNGYNVIDTTIADNPCGISGKFYWPVSDDDAKDMLSLALAALMSQKDVSVVYDETQRDCKWDGVQLATHFRIHR